MSDALNEAFDMDDWMLDQGLKRGNTWEVYKGKGKQEFCDVRLRSGRETGPCWPNAGVFIDMADDEKEIPDAEVTHVLYYVDANTDLGDDADDDEDDERREF